MHTHSMVDILTRVIAVCSILHMLLPPWEAFNDFPTVQKFYKLGIYIIGYAAGNARSTIYPTISTNSGQQPSPAATLNPVQTPPAPSA